MSAIYPLWPATPLTWVFHITPTGARISEWLFASRELLTLREYVASERPICVVEVDPGLLANVAANGPVVLPASIDDMAGPESDSMRWYLLIARFANLLGNSDFEEGFDNLVLVGPRDALNVMEELLPDAVLDSAALRLETEGTLGEESLREFLRLHAHDSPAPTPSPRAA